MRLLVILALLSLCGDAPDPCRHCDDGTPDKPGMPACPDFCEPPF